MDSALLTRHVDGAVELQPARAESDACVSVTDYERVVDILIRHYTRIDRVAELLPSVSVMPYIKFLWSVIKFEFAVIGDILLILPINAVILIRNIFPGRWSYKSFCWRYLKAALYWLWSGEYSIPFIHIRVLSIFLLHWHFRTRLLTLRRDLLLQSSFSEDNAKAALVKIDRAVDFWGSKSLGSVFLTWVLPLIGPAIELVKFFTPLSLPQWSSSLALMSIGYVLNIPVSAFVVKRGLMLGGSGREAYYPGFLTGSGYYSQERDLFNSLGLKTREFPLDLIFLLGGSVAAFLTYNNQLKLYEDLGLQVQWKPTFVSMMIILPSVIILMIVSWVRRKKLGRA